MRPLAPAIAIATLLAAACSDSSREQPPPPSAKPAPTPESPAPKPPSFDQPKPDQPRPSSQPPAGYHLDPDPEPSHPVRAARAGQTRSIELILRSSPPGATASVDGQAVGKTPAYWQGTADGRPRDVTFALPGYAVARYRFVATTSGVVHGTLHKLVKAEPEAEPAN